jgi:hypothetical protein
VWINQGGDQGGVAGNFADSGQALGNSDSKRVSLGDLDGDGDLDAWVVSWIDANRVWINQGGIQGGVAGNFADSGQALGNFDSFDVSLGDLDGDGDLDACVANIGAHRVWINQGGVQGGVAGNFLDSGQALGNSNSRGVSLGDFDGDGDLDAWVANWNSQANRVWINQGGIQGGVAGDFTDSGQALGNSNSSDVSLGDLDGDGDLDAWVANLNQPNRVWINDGLGNYTDSGQALGNSGSLAVSLGDLDGDGDLDAWVANYSNQANRVWINDGGLQGGPAGNFTDSGQAPAGNSDSTGVSLTDLDGDGDLDAWVTIDRGPTTQANRVLINQGGIQGGVAGNFLESGQALGNSNSSDVAIGDLDGDGDLDAWVANRSQANRVWINQGGDQGGVAGNFADSGQALGNSNSRGVALGDLDGDGDLDAWIANLNQPNRVWINDGLGNFTDSGQALGNSGSTYVDLGDLEGDGDLDVWVANYGQANRVWINDGGLQGGTAGNFTDSGQALGNSESTDVALGDLDGDGDLDAWVANLGVSNRVFENLLPCAPDDDGDGIPNICDIDQSAGEDCNGNGIIDSCDISGGAADSDSNGIPDECEETPFTRGDVNGDGGVDISDVITTLDYLFTGGTISCENSTDSNDDGMIDITDPVQLLSYLFDSGVTLPAPSPGCGIDPTPDALECENYGGCP